MLEGFILQRTFLRKQKKYQNSLENNYGINYYQTANDLPLPTLQIDKKLKLMLKIPTISMVTSLVLQENLIYTTIVKAKSTHLSY